MEKGQIDDFLKNNKEVITGVKEHYNIDFFGRYTWGVLKDMYENKDKKPTRSLAVLAYPKSDWNGVFYSDIPLIKTLSKHYDLRIFESGKKSDFKKYLEKMKESYGKCDLLIISGHGSPTSITLGGSKLTEAETEKKTGKELVKLFEEELGMEISLLDEDVFNTLGGAINKGAAVILQSCSTGDSSTMRSIANVLSGFVDGVVYAPDKPTGTPNVYIDDSNGKPKIMKVVYP
jgi:hypothetical protein